MKVSHLFLYLIFVAACTSIENDTTKEAETKKLSEDETLKLIPVIDSRFYSVAPEPDLQPFGLQPTSTPGVQPNQPNDHTIFQTGDGKWHLWACVRDTKVGRVLVHWLADSITQSPWKLTGEIHRAKRQAGESMVDWQQQEFIQSPYVVKHNNTYYMFYGGYDSGLNADGDTIDPAKNYNEAEKQICLMTSEDGYQWKRHKNAEGLSRVALGPGAARDPCIVQFGNIWYMYYCGHHHRNRTCGAIYVRTSDDLIHWSDWQIAHYDKNSEGKKWLPESPAVVYRKGYYYLFRTHGTKSGCYVYRSKNPMNFGQGDVSGYFVTHLPRLIACEIVTTPNGKEYISTITNGKKYGILLAKLKWVNE